jgi:hypothetical protein
VKIGDPRAELFMDKAYEQGVIDERVFSIKFGGDDASSMITFGGYDSERFAKEELSWYPNYTPYGVHYFWAVWLEAVNIGDRSLSNFTRMAVVDSGSSYLLMPYRSFQNFVADLQEISEAWVDDYGQAYVGCGGDLYNQLPEFTFTIGGKQYRVPRESLYKPYGWHQDNCYAEVTALPGWNEWILGLTFLENYYAVYDMETL